MLKRAACVTVLLAMTAPSSWALGRDKAKFMGGTAATVPAKTEGTVDLSDPTNMVFIAKSGRLKVPWTNILTIEYGQDVSRRWKTAIFISPLLSRVRKHIVTITYKDSAGTDQAAVFEFGTDIYRLALAALKAKSGKDFTCQDEEAKKQFGSGCKVEAGEPEAK